MNEEDSASDESDEFGDEYHGQPHHDDDFDEFDVNNSNDFGARQPAKKEQSGTKSVSGSKPNSAKLSVDTPTTVVKNQPFDEVMENLDTDSEVDSDASPNVSPMNKKQPPSMSQQLAAKQQQRMPMETLPTSQRFGADEEDEESGEEEESEEEDDEESEATKPRAYDPKEFSQLPVAREVSELFAFITAYKPHDIELESKLKPFIPEYTAAVGDLDPFLKVARPDGKNDDLGLKVLDEPAAKQSDPAVITLALSYSSRDVQRKVVNVNSIESAEKNPKKVQKWIDDIRELHRTKPPPSVHYSKPMPDLDFLMQAWPDEFEETLAHIDLPSADIDLSLDEYARVICSLLDIPVYNNTIESLHVLFTLYLEFKQNNHFGSALGV